MANVKLLETVSAKVTIEERQLIETAMHAARARSLSEFVREQLIASLKEVPMGGAEA